MVVHVFLYATTTNFAASLLYWERLLAGRHREKQREEQTKGGGHGQSRPQQSSGLSLRKLVVVEAVQMALSLVLLGFQISFDQFSNQYVYLLPVVMFVSEVFVHFGGGRAE